MFSYIYSPTSHRVIHYYITHLYLHIIKPNIYFTCCRCSGMQACIIAMQFVRGCLFPVILLMLRFEMPFAHLDSWSNSWRLRRIHPRGPWYYVLLEYSGSTWVPGASGKSAYTYVALTLPTLPGRGAFPDVPLPGTWDIRKTCLKLLNGKYLGVKFI